MNAASRTARPRVARLLTVLLGALLAAAGCGAPVRVVAIDDSLWFSRQNRSALDGNEASERAQQYLRREALLDDWIDDHEKLLLQLHQRVIERRDRVVAVHVAELAFLQAKQNLRRGTEAELRDLLTCVEHAWSALFDPALEPAPNSFDPAFRLACDLYNRASARILKYWVAHRDAPPGPRFDVVGGSLAFRFEHSDFEWDPRDYDELVIAYDIDVMGLPRSARTYGIGVPTILTRKLPAGEGEALPENHALVSTTYSATVLLRFDGSLIDRKEGKERSVRIEVYDPLQSSSVEVGGAKVPLEADLSCALAYTLSRMPEVSGVSAMFNPEEYQAITRLLMLQPYDPEKIPVVFVHGLLSNPVTWVPLLNDLLADPSIRARFQFWFFRYPTGNPILYSASLLRSALADNVQRLDPAGTNPNLHQMVLVGHSMGGLLSRLQVRPSEDKLWNLIAKKPFDESMQELEMGPADTELMRRVFFFERLDFIRRVVFMATPHRGAELATSWPARLGNKLISLPRRLTGALGKMLSTTSEAVGNVFRIDLLKNRNEEGFTGVGNLAPDNLVGKEIANWPFPDDLPVHSVIGNEDGAEAGGSDGLVPYESSHLDGVASETILHAGHNLHVEPEAAVELRRILLLHLQAVDAGKR